MHLTSRYVAVAVLALAIAGPAPAAPVGTAFTYQGELSDNGAPLTDSADLQFTLYDAVFGGVLTGATVQIDSVAVAAGRFTVQCDFGDVFDGTALWMEIAVRTPHDPSDIGAFTTLNPRQPLTAAPFALHAENGGWTTVGNALTNDNNGGFVGINRTTPVGAEVFGIRSPAPSGYGGMYVSMDPGSTLPFYGYYTGNQFAWHYLDGATGDWRLHVDGDRMTVTELGNVGIGTITPGEKLQVTGTIQSTAGGFRFPDGTLQTTAASGAGSGNTLDDAYNEGGSGAGAQIDTNFGPVTLMGTDGLTIDSNGTPPALQVTQSTSGNLATFTGTLGQVSIRGDRIGVGTSSPSFALDVNSSSTNANVAHIERDTVAVANADLLELRVLTGSDPNTQLIEAEVGADIKFRVWGDGDVSADGTVSAPADFAEMVAVTRGVHTVEAGDVMVINPNSHRGFEIASEPRSALVAGVYSTNPGFLGSEHDWDQVALERGLIARPAPG
ncbi:MAG: hypothetical protein HKN12_09475, partial [Gemmatimonadetes bacterium]|nr:hypothetical protein [Gemmatimonadota bacterium]